MNIGAGDYYSIDAYGYKKYPNVEVIGIDSRQLNNFKTHLQSTNRSMDKQVQQESVIKQEDIQYDPQQARYQLETGLNEPRQIIQKSEVNSVHMSIGGNKIPPANLTYSCFDKNTTPYKGILKRSMQELENNLTSQEDSVEYRQLCIQLDKEKRMRKELEQSYKNLLSEIQKNQRYYQTDFNNEQGSRHQKRQSSGRTLRTEMNRKEPIQSCQELQHITDKNENKSEIKTVKKIQIQRDENIKLLQSEEEANNEEHYEHEEEYINSNQKYRKEYLNQQETEEEEENDYFRQEREFQGKILFDLSNLSRKITDIDNFLIESSEIREKERLNKVIEEKEKEIKRIELQNARLKQGNQVNFSAINQVSNNHLQNIINNMTPNTLYLFAILLMAIVAIAS